MTGTSTSLAVLGADSDGGGESNLAYTWSQTGGPAGATFAANGTNAAKNTTVAFTQAGNYTFLATITDAGGLSTTSAVSITGEPDREQHHRQPGRHAWLGSHAHFTASAYDQFGNAMQTQPAFTWSNTGMARSTVPRACTRPPSFGHGHGHGHQRQRERFHRSDRERRGPHGRLGGPLAPQR